MAGARLIFGWGCVSLAERPLAAAVRPPDGAPRRADPAMEKTSMHPVVRRLHRDHAHLDEVLDLLERRVNAFHDGEPIDFELIAMVLEYLADYADRVHHRLEDRLFAPLQERDDAVGPLARQVMQQHPHLSSRTRQLQNTIEGVVHDAVVTREELEQQARAFIGLQREHLRLEENRLLPRLEVMVGAAALDAAAAGLPDEEDPVFGTQRRERFLNLFERLREASASNGGVS
jgi:hemerythrin-like domain-containing protein